MLHCRYILRFGFDARNVHQVLLIGREGLAVEPNNFRVYFLL